MHHMIVHDNYRVKFKTKNMMWDMIDTMLKTHLHKSKYLFTMSFRIDISLPN
jgi:hypothetical protein